VPKEDDWLYERCMEIESQEVWDGILAAAKENGCHFMFKMWWHDWDYRQRQKLKSGASAPASDGTREA
jgi:hypothetical protein